MIFTLHFHQAMTAANNPDQPGARMPCETRKVFGFSVAVSSVEEMSSALAERALEAQAPCLVAAADVHVITLGVHDRGYGAVLERMDVVCPDGMPVVWKLNRGLPAGERSAERVSGPDLMEALVRANAEYPGLRHFLLGGGRPEGDAGGGCLKRGQCGVGGPGLPEAGAVDGGAEGAAASRGLCGRGSGLRLPCRNGEARAPVDAEKRPGMAIPHLPGAGQAAQAVREA